ncbi:hypothetical protein TU94_00130 [Streptomyces cyaneogriseus subsp. noncyanogenus]|uniref:Uncharacterized protein n=1 Tax=Streptomyces cyaneogriseus subsp. noncyanogenus TaxID=477245 RepID=A0A0C5FRB1_9ACTN|nr:hypothetical protein TU94_00130 [Streptomyces cyaneogriseus subsp. noncyanogenus]
MRRPQTLVLGRLDEEGVLRPVGRSTPLRPNAARDLAERLTPPRSGHPWDGVRFTTYWRSRTPLDVVLVEPVLVAEIMVDTALERGSWRHPVRLARIRAEMHPMQLPKFEELGENPGQDDPNI